MILYCFITYLVMLGALVEHNHSFESVSLKEWGCFILSPIILPIIIGMMLKDR